MPESSITAANAIMPNAVLRFDNWGYRHASRRYFSVRGLNLTVEAGQRVLLLGASGIVFMLIMLASLSGFSGGIPVTMLLVAALYLGQQVYDIIFAHDNVANFMHIVGGVCGTAFGYVYAMLPRKRRRPAARKKR